MGPYGQQIPFNLAIGLKITRFEVKIQMLAIYMQYICIYRNARQYSRLVLNQGVQTVVIGI